jgi:hypothetical protein
VFFTMMWLILWVLWFFLLFRVITDIFRSRDLGGWGKAGWHRRERDRLVHTAPWRYGPVMAS